MNKDEKSIEYLEDEIDDTKFREVLLQYKQDAFKRENELFLYTKTIVGRLFYFSMVLISTIALAIVFCKTSPWLITLGTISLLIPTTLLGCFMYHIYHDRSIEKPIREFLAKTPVSEILNEFKEFLITRGK